jgi:hypothetical protein
MLQKMLFRLVCSLCLSEALTGCGTTTPNIQEFWGDENDAGAMESAVANEIECELAVAVRAIHRQIHEKPQYERELEARYGYIFGWNAQAVLTFAVDEQSNLNPTPSLIRILHPLSKSQTFTLGLNGNYKNQATRTDKVTLTYKIRDFLEGSDPVCKSGVALKGSVFVRSDLKIGEWLRQALNISASQSLLRAAPRYPKKVDAISHDVKFDILWVGGIAPAWKLVKFGTSTNPLLGGQRDRSQDLLLTMGPPDSAHPDQLGPAGRDSILSSQISNAVSNLERIGQ